jgi:beta-glucanase (GH16 family)
VIAAAGDIANSASGDEKTARLVEAINPDRVLTLGDNVYPDGTLQEFNTHYEPTWGRFKEKTRPSPGNHEYHTNGVGYYDYFGALAGERDKGYYSWDLGDWHMVALNSNIDRKAGSAQEMWLRSDLARNRSSCTLAYWHHPRWNIGTKGDNASQAALWNALYDYGADVVLVGHDHNYQRYYRLDKEGRRDDAFGIHQFTAGTGGAGHYPVSMGDPAEVVNSDTFGVLKLVLRSNSYDWEFVPEDGRIFTDSGSETCHGKPADAQPRDPTAGKALTWADEFNGAAGSPPDLANWVYDRGGGGWGNSELQCYTSRPENSSHDGQGNLRIVARAEASNCATGNQYTSARLKTVGKREFQYGYVEGRLKVPPGQGIWPAFWTLGADIGSVGWPTSGEMDILEVIGRQPNIAHQTIIGPRTTGAHWKLPNQTEGPAWHEEFHTYGLEWSENRVTFYIDGRETRTFTPRDLQAGWQWAFNKPYYLLLNIAVGGTWPGNPDATTPFPATMLVDYVRVYQ